MKPVKGIAITAFILVFVSSAFGYHVEKRFGKITTYPKGHVATTEYTPEFITTYPKGHVATTEYTPELIVNYDKQHIPWSESKLKPLDKRPEGQKDLLEEIAKCFSGR